MLNIPLTDEILGGCSSRNLPEMSTRPTASERKKGGLLLDVIGRTDSESEKPGVLFS